MEINEGLKIKVIATTGNKNKLKEFQEILNPFNIEITTFEKEGYNPIEVVEDGTTFEENSYKKAREIMEATWYYPSRVGCGSGENFPSRVWWKS